MFYASLCSCLNIVNSDIIGGHLHIVIITITIIIMQLFFIIYTGRFMAFLLSLRTVESLGISVLLYRMLTVVPRDN